MRSFPAHSKQVFYCFCGAQEAPGNVALTKAYAKHLDKVLGAHVTLSFTRAFQKHTRRPILWKKFPDWMGEILRSVNESLPQRANTPHAPGRLDYALCFHFEDHGPATIDEHRSAPK